jgi:nucleotide-binding universal stress UspA family protein
MTANTNGVLVGYDGSPGSEQALSWAVREARSRGLPLTVCHAWSPGFHVLPGDAAVFDLARQCGERVMADGLQHARRVMAPDDVHPQLIEGPAAAMLCERSDGAGMVVVGSQGRSGVAGLLLGSVSSQVAAYGHGRVVVVRGHWRPAAGYAPGPIVVGVDGSAVAQAAGDFAFEEAALRDAPLLAVCALADAPGGLGGARERAEDFEQTVGLWEKEHPEVTVSQRISVGGARDALLAAAHGAQMLVIGSRGRGGVRGMMLGSISRAVLDHAPCPVGVVHKR